MLTKAGKPPGEPAHTDLAEIHRMLAGQEPAAKEMTRQQQCAAKAKKAREAKKTPNQKAPASSTRTSSDSSGIRAAHPVHAAPFALHTQVQYVAWLQPYPTANTPGYPFSQGMYKIPHTVLFSKWFQTFSMCPKGFQN